MAVTIITGDCRTALASLPDGMAQTCVTSPPYFGLRDYGTGTWDGGDADCDHINPTAHQKQGKTSARAGRANIESQRNETFRTTCGRCGATRVDRQIGLEASVEEYVAQLVAVFRDVRRVLRDDGTLWLNLGDSYAGAGKTGESGIKPKDMIGVPWRVAFALQADGWYLRSDIIWAKPNPMPESVRDRPTKAHEYIFLLAKSERYFYDAQAVMEPAVYGEQHASKATSWGTNRKHPNKANAADYAFAGNNHTTSRMADGSYGRNKRTVWTVTTKPFKGAHFATFPPDLIEPCIKAGSSERGQCASCGAPWIRTTEELVSWRIGAVDKVQAYASGSGNRRARSTKGGMSKSEHKTTGWAASCDCNAAIVPQTVIDPFGGAGTTGLVANRLGRNAVLVELNPEYAELASARIASDAPLMTAVTVTK